MKLSEVKFVFKNNGRDTLVYIAENSSKEEVKSGKTVTVDYSVVKNFDKSKDFELVGVELPKEPKETKAPVALTTKK